jgi:CRISPR-associated protein Csb3
MSKSEPNITIPVDLTNPGQFFACCGLLELADRLWPGTESWFERDLFQLGLPVADFDDPFAKLTHSITSSELGNTMSAAQIHRLEQLGAMSKRDRSGSTGLEDEKKKLEALRREEPILVGAPFGLRIDWFRDDDAGGSRFKTWAGQQSVLDIAIAMKLGIQQASIGSESTLWNDVRRMGLPFNFDSDLGGQGSALDIGFSFDPLAASEMTRIQGTCRPALEMLAFVGLQRFRPREVPDKNRFVYAAWQRPLQPSAAAAVACQAVRAGDPCYEFRLLYRTKYLKSFLPAIPFQGEDDERS